MVDPESLGSAGVEMFDEFSVAFACFALAHFLNLLTLFDFHIHSQLAATPKLANMQYNDNIIFERVVFREMHFINLSHPPLLGEPLLFSYNQVQNTLLYECPC